MTGLIHSAGGAWLGHSLGVGAACASLAVGASLMQIMHYSLRKSAAQCLTAAQRYPSTLPRLTTRLDCSLGG